MINKLHNTITKQNGYFNAHSHLDRANTFSYEEYKEAHLSLQEKWVYVDNLKKKSSEQDYFDRFKIALNSQKEFGVTKIVSFVDCDPSCEMRAIDAAVEAKRYAKDILNIELLIACQTLKGVLKKESIKWIEKSLDKIDIIGGLPATDKGEEKLHIEKLLSIGRETNKPVHVHVDQLDEEREKETELLARLVIKHNMHGKVLGIHGISIAAQNLNYRTYIYGLLQDSQVGFISCPTAWLDRRRREDLLPVHNSVTPIDEMIPRNIPIFIGSDNICDIYKPYSDGNMLTELRTLLESTHYYNFDKLVEIATFKKNNYFGFKNDDT